jgi:hypothetical protein
MSTSFAPAVVAAAIFALPAAAGTPRPADARIYIVSPADGAVVDSPVTVVFGLEGMGVAPAGIEMEATGHHHLLIDVPAAEVDRDDPLPADDAHRHFGGGQTQATIELEPGEHRLQLLFADHNHVPHDPPLVSEAVTITVRE